MPMLDSPEITTIEFGASYVISSTDLIGLYVDHESACNRFRVRELNTGGAEWILSDLQPLYGHYFSGGDLEIKVASPIVGDVFPGYSGSRILMFRRSRCAQESLPNLPLVPVGRPATRVVRQVVRMPATAAAAFTVSSAYIEGYQYATCMLGADGALAGASWQILGHGARADTATHVDSPQVFATNARLWVTGTGKGNAAPPLLGGGGSSWDVMSVAAEPLPFVAVQCFVFNVPPAFLTTPPGSVIWQFSNQPITERF
jgi:hypothetical protein